MTTLPGSTGSLALEAEGEKSLRQMSKVGELDMILGERAPGTATHRGSGYSGLEEHSTPLHAFLEHSTTFLFPVLFALNLYLSMSQLHELDWLWLVLLAIPLSLVIGDLASGVVHWTADTYFSEETPVIGPSLVKPFRMHHLYPRDICTHNLVTTVGNVCIIAVPVLSFCLYLLWIWPGSLWLAFAILSLTLMSATTVATNQFHKWAHQERPSNRVRWLQRMRLVLAPSHHEVHHTAPFNTHYCITNGWLNPLLNKLKFFRGLEGTLRLLGIEVTKSKH